MADINLTQAVRSNLSSLQNVSAMMAKTQDRLSSGNKVNSALDNPTNFFTASSLNARAGDLNNLMDSMANGIKTIEAADNGLKAITKTVETMQSLARQARADKTAAAVSPGTVVAGAAATPNTSTTAGKISFDLGGGVSVAIDSATGATARSVTDIVADINGHASLSGKVKAENVGGQLTLQNLTGTAVGVTGFSAAASVTGLASTASTLAAGSSTGMSDTRKSLMNQFNDLRGKLDELSADASFNGINLLQGDELKLNFNETGTSSTTVQGKNADGTVFGALSSTKLGITAQATFDSDIDLDTLTGNLQTALGSLRSQASAYGSALSTVQNRQDFTKSMINTLETGAGNLTLADMNQEAANMLALQTRQSLAQSTLAMANQADQGVLQLLR